MKNSTINVSAVNSSTIVQCYSSSTSEVKEENDDKSTVAIGHVRSSLQVNGINQMDFEIKKDYDSDCDCEDCRVQKAIEGIRETKPFVCERIKCRKLCVKKEENDDDDEITSKEVTGNQTNSEEKQVGNERSLIRKTVEGQEDVNSPCSSTPDNVPPFIGESDDDTEIDDEMHQESVTNIVGQDESNPNDLDSENESEINTNQTDNSGSRSPSQVRRSTRMLGKPTKSYREEFFGSDNESDYELFDGETTDEDSEVEERLISRSIKRKRESSGVGEEDSERESSVGSNLNNSFNRKHNSVKSVCKNNEEKCCYEVLSLKCMICQKLTKKDEQQSAKSKLDKHLENVHRIQEFRCSLLGCFASFKKTVELSKHLKTKHSRVSKWKCEHCSKVVSSNPKLNLHITYVHQQGHYRCKFPSCEFASHQSRLIVRKHFYKNHRIRIRTNLRLLCPVDGCGKVLKTNADLSRHSLTHSNVRPFQCEQCKAFFKTKSNMIHHQRVVHLGLQPFYCKWPDCKFQCHSEIVTFQHVQEKHFKNNRGDPNIFVKKRTDEEYEWAPLVKRPHRRNCSVDCDNPGHTDRPFKCELCKIGFKLQSLLLQHQRGVHLGLKPFYCKWYKCRFQTYSKKDTVQHVEGMHLKTNDTRDPTKYVQKRTDKEYEAAQHSTKLRESKQSYKINLNCLVDNCDKQFSDQIELNVHMEESHQINRFQCLVQACNASFKYNLDLSRHLKDDHENVEIFACAKCTSSYRSHGCLRQHNRNNHQIVHFSCNYPPCGFECKTNKCNIPGFINIHRHYEQYVKAI